MSGICGIIRFDRKSVEKKEIQKMLDSMENYENDAEGLWINGNVGLGHKMFWTTPESLHEEQPLFSKDGKQILVSDARIDNREELIEQLIINKDINKVITDADLILLAYQKWNEECPKYLIGDYAFVIWNINTQQLFCVRDPMGIKQFYYYKTDSYFVFGSSIASILTDKNIKKSPNISVIKKFIKTISLSHENTFYENINRLSPAHTLKISAKIAILRRYWFPEDIKINQHLTKDEAIKKFNELFALSINARLRSAYPIGAQLSGGLDSSSVVAVACTMHNKDILTAFSLHYGDLECDESSYSKELIKKYNINAEIIRGDLLDYEKTYTIERFNKENPDWPGAGLCIPDIAILDRAKNLGIRIMLTGQGGDQLLTGNMLMLADYLKRGRMIRLYKELKYYGFSKSIILNYIVKPLLPIKIKNILYIILYKKVRRKKDNIGTSQRNTFLSMKKKKHNSLAQYDDLSMIIGAGNAFWLSSSFPISERYNIEYRHPFFDKRLIEFSLSLPSYIKMEQGIDKKILREALGEMLPSIIRNRKDKAEFSEILKIQFSSSKIEKNDICKIFDYALVDYNKFTIALKDFQNNRIQYPIILWNTILIEKWLKNI